MSVYLSSTEAVPGDILADAKEGLVGEDLLDVAVHEHQGGRGHGGELGEGVR